MKKTLILFITLTVIFGQADKKPDSEPKDKAKKAITIHSEAIDEIDSCKRLDRDSKIKSRHTTGRCNDERINVKNISFIRKFQSRGQGDILETVFDIENNTDEDIKIKMFILGFYEQDIVSIKRKWKGYPKWRIRDFEKNVFKVRFVDSVPEIKEEDFIKYKEKQNKEVDAIAKKNKKDKKKGNDSFAAYFNYSDFLSYVNYINTNLDKGIEFDLLGMHGAAAEVKTKHFYNEKLYKIDYHTVMRPLRTTVITQIFSRYTKKNYFFNHIGIILYDSKNKQVLFRQFMKFRRPLRIH